MQLSEKDKQALQEKYKAQRQAMWSGKQSTSQESEEKTAEVDQGDATSSDLQPDPSSMAADQPSSTETADEETNQSESSTQPKSGSEGDAPAASSAQNIDDGEKASQSPMEVEASAPEAENPIMENTEEQEEEGQATEGERVFWETLEQEGGASILTWKIALAVIGVAIVLVGVGVWLGFLFAG